jgi:competence protein ComEA
MDKRRLLVVLAVALAAGAAIFRSARPAAPAAPSLLEPRAIRSAAPASLVVYVAGRVLRPGVYHLPAGARAEAALRAAGGATSGADPVAVNLAQALHDGEEVIVPALGEPPAAGVRACAAPRRRTPSHGSRYSRQRAGGAAKTLPSTPIDLNHADAVLLQSLPGIGPRLAQRIIAFREQNGFFNDAQELLDINGLSESVLREIEPYVVFGKP